mmetsp:Transcript_16285/g.56932  ORF Transcript_16285/g.56932 Transcript_16285/m.56932 type:complete len:273 (-) Transcript_16285:573-1391(-)
MRSASALDMPYTLDGSHALSVDTNMTAPRLPVSACAATQASRQLSMPATLVATHSCGFASQRSICFSAAARMTTCGSNHRRDRSIAFASRMSPRCVTSASPANSISASCCFSSSRDTICTTQPSSSSRRASVRPRLPEPPMIVTRPAPAPAPSTRRACDLPEERAPRWDAQRHIDTKSTASLISAGTAPASAAASTAVAPPPPPRRAAISADAPGRARRSRHHRRCSSSCRSMGMGARAAASSSPGGGSGGSGTVGTASDAAASGCSVDRLR